MVKGQLVQVPLLTPLFSTTAPPAFTLTPLRVAPSVGRVEVDQDLAATWPTSLVVSAVSGTPVQSDVAWIQVSVSWNREPKARY